MEGDLYNRNAVEAHPSTETYQAPPDAKYYPIAGETRGLVILPLRNLLLDDIDIKIALNQLQPLSKAKDKTQALQKLSNDLRELYLAFKSKKPLKPITIRQFAVI